MTTRKASCTGKVRYASRKAAKTALRRLRGQGGARDDHVHAYRCDWCDFWHLGHLSPLVFRGVISKDAWRNA